MIRFVLAAVLLALPAGAVAQSNVAAVTVYPVAVQVGGKFTQHSGFAVRAGVELRPRVAVSVGLLRTTYAEETDFVRELTRNARIEPQPSVSSLMRSAATANLELRPFKGVLEVSDSLSVEFDVFVAGGIGGVTTFVTARPAGMISGPQYLDTGATFAHEVAAGLHIDVGPRVFFRAEARQLSFVTHVFGDPHVRFMDGFSFWIHDRPEAHSLPFAFLGTGVTF